MTRSATASAPGRICLAGEDLDWIVGPSVLAAVALRTTVTVTSPSPGPESGALTLESGPPFRVRRVIPLSEIANYDGHVLDYAQAAIATLTRTVHLPLEGLRITISS